MQTQLTVGGAGRWLARKGLWLGLIGLPLAYCLLPLLSSVLVASRIFEPLSDIYIAGQALDPNPPIWRWPDATDLLRVALVAALLAWPVLLAGAGGALLLGLGLWLLRRRWPQWQLTLARSLGRLVLHLLGLLALAYILGFLVHLLLPNILFNPPPLPEDAEFRAAFGHEEYWWPYYVPPAAAQRGWTIFNPAYTAAFFFPGIKASSIKLGALLATLLVYRRQRRRSAATSFFPFVRHEAQPS